MLAWYLELLASSLAPLFLNLNLFGRMGIFLSVAVGQLLAFLSSVLLALWPHFLVEGMHVVSRTGFCHGLLWCHPNLLVLPLLFPHKPAQLNQSTFCPSKCTTLPVLSATVYVFPCAWDGLCPLCLWIPAHLSFISQLKCLLWISPLTPIWQLPVPWNFSHSSFSFSFFFVREKQKKFKETLIFFFFFGFLWRNEKNVKNSYYMPTTVLEHWGYKYKI